MTIESGLSELPAQPDRDERVENHEVGDLPTTVQKLFAELPTDLRERLAEPNNRRHGDESPQESLVKTVAAMTTEDRQTLLEVYLFELFHNDPPEKIIMAEDPKQLGVEAAALLETLWSNRGRSGTGLTLINGGHYEEFRTGCKKITDEIKLLREELSHVRRRKSDYPPQRAVTLQSKIEDREKELEDWNSYYGNGSVDGMYFRDISSRERKERIWLESVATVMAYLDPLEVAALMDTQLKKFFQPAAAGRDSDDRLRIEKLNEAIGLATTGWEETHRDEPALITTKAVRSEQRVERLAEYFHELTRSFRENRARGQNDTDQNVTTKQMEVVLTILNKH